ncbi:hypothetical protein K470DRAFT_204999, partial [Piedraia hortae CBS 480.64]
ANERTYLDYLRTSLAVSMLGVVLTQLAALHNPGFRFSVTNKVMACVFQAVAAGITVLGGVRFFSQQNAMTRGKSRTGGWEMLSACGLVLMVISPSF